MPSILGAVKGVAGSSISGEVWGKCTSYIYNRTITDLFIVLLFSYVLFKSDNKSKWLICKQCISYKKRLAINTSFILFICDENTFVLNYVSAIFTVFQENNSIPEITQRDGEHFGEKDI